MDWSGGNVGLLTEDGSGREQRGALERLREFDPGARTIAPGEIAGNGRNGDGRSGARLAEELDVLWLHGVGEREPSKPLVDAAAAIDAYVEEGGNVLLTGAAMAGIDDLAVETVPPDVVETDHAAEPTGLLWRSVYDDHPVPAAIGGLRIPVRDSGLPTVARYERILPANGEILASTVRGDRDVPHEMRVVAWNRDRTPGTVLGVGSGLVFDGGEVGPFAENRNTVLSGCLAALVGEYEHPARPKEAFELAAMRESLADTPHRPDYHVTAPANWLNDPNGLIEWNGRYHVFYQYNPAGPFHNTMHWGHAVSDDLVTWRDEPVALSPSPEGPDRDGCWSGCAVDDGGTPTILYTGGDGRRQLPCLATADGDHLCRWTKHNENPVITDPPDDVAVLETEHWEAEFRDHAVWREDGTWHQLIGSGVAEAGGAVFLYTSDDLRNWRYEGPMLIGDWEGSGPVWECPELLDLGEKQLLHVSNYDDVHYFLGQHRDGRFDIDRRGILDHGDFYAPQSIRDGDRTLTFGWLPEARETAPQWDAGWSGALSLPREISVDPGGRLRQQPAREVASLRERELDLPESLPLEGGQRERLDTGGRRLELDVEIRIDDADAIELAVFESPDREEYTPVRYTRDGELVVDRATASRADCVSTGTQRMTVPPYDEPLRLRAFLDGSVLELYANERHCLTSRVYPTHPESTGISVTARRGHATITSLSGWRLGEAFDQQSGESACSCTGRRNPRY